MTESSEIGEKKTEFRLDIINGSSNGEEDRLSSLLDVLLIEILSLLPIKSAAATSALSTRWRRLWTQLTRLRLTDPTTPKMQDYFANIDHILGQLTSPKIQTFTLCFPYYICRNYKSKGYASRVESWIRRICSRNPDEIELGPRHYSPFPFVILPSSLFECQSLKVLILEGSFDYKVLDDGISIHLPNLKRLHRTSRCYADRQLITSLVKSCPLLEDLYLKLDWYNDGFCVDISARNLKCLRLHVISRQSQFTIDAPNLDTFEFSGFRSTWFRFTTYPIGLLMANVVIRPYSSNKTASNYRRQSLEIIQGISSVRSLCLSARKFNREFHSLGYLNNDLLPIFHNLTHITILDCWKDFLSFLQWFPSLEDLYLSNDILVIPEVVPGSVPGCLVSELKRIKLRSIIGSDEELKFLNYILSNANVLELLEVHIWENMIGIRSEEFKFCKSLFSHTRRSCEVKFFGKHLSASSKDFKHGFLESQIRCDN